MNAHTPGPWGHITGLDGEDWQKFVDDARAILRAVKGE